MKDRPPLDSFKLSPAQRKTEREELLEVLKGIDGEKGEQGERGEKGDKGDAGLRGPKGDNGKYGVDGRDGIDGTNGQDGIDGKDGSPDTPDQIVAKVNKAKKKIKFDRIEALDERLKTHREELDRDFGNNIRNIQQRGGPSQVLIKASGVEKARVVSLNFTNATVTPTGDGTNVDITTSGSGSGQVNSIVAGTGIGVNSTDPANPIVSATGGGTGTVTSVASADGSVTVTNGTTAADLAVIKTPKLSTARTIGGTSFDGTANIKIGALNTTNVGATTSAELAGVLSDETGSGAVVFANTPTLVTPVLGAATGTSLTLGGGTTLTTTNQTGTGSLVLASSPTLTSPTLTTPTLGTPASGTLTNTTGLPISGLVASTSTALGVGSIELGNASDTTLSRSSGGVLAVEGVVVDTISGTNTLTNKRMQSRTASSTTASTLTPDVSSANAYYRTTQTAALTINAPIGTPVIGETIAIYVDSASAQTLTMDATYIAFGAAFPASTTAGKTLMITAQYNGTNWKTLWANAV